MSNLTLLIIVLIAVVLASMFFGYRFVVTKLVDKGMKESDAHTFGKASALLVFVALVFVYFKYLGSI